MPAGQQYATNVPQTNLTGLINPTATLMSVQSSSGWPATPFTAILDIGTSLQEPVDVTNITGTTWTIVRAIDGTVGFTHPVNSTVTHGDIGRDFREARTHMDATTAQHGLGGGVSFVGDTTTQNLSNKTIVAATYSGAQAMGSGAWTGTGGLTEASVAFTGLSGATGGTTRLAGSTSAAGPPSSGTFSTNDVVFDQATRALWACTSGGTPGTWAPLTQGLIATSTPTGSSVTFSSIPSGFRHLRIEYVARTSNAGGTGIDRINMQWNGITAAVYDWTAYGTNQPASAFNDGSSSATSMGCGYVWTSHIATTSAGRGIIDIPFYSETTYQKSIIFTSTQGDGGSVGSTVSGGGTGSLTGSVGTITIATGSGNFLTGSTFNLYGLP